MNYFLTALLILCAAPNLFGAESAEDPTTGNLILDYEKEKKQLIVPAQIACELPGLVKMVESFALAPDEKGTTIVPFSIPSYAAMRHLVSLLALEKRYPVEETYSSPTTEAFQETEQLLYAMVLLELPAPFFKKLVSIVEKNLLASKMCNAFLRGKTPGLRTFLKNLDDSEQQDLLPIFSVAADQTITLKPSCYWRNFLVLSPYKNFIADLNGNNLVTIHKPELSDGQSVPGEKVCALYPPTYGSKPVHAFYFSPKEKYCVVFFENNSLRIKNLREPSAKEHSIFLNRDHPEIASHFNDEERIKKNCELLWNSDETRIVVRARYCIDLEAGAITHQIDYENDAHEQGEDPMDKVTFSPDLQWVAYPHEDNDLENGERMGFVVLINCATGVRSEIDTGYTEKIWGPFAFTADSTFLIVGTSKGDLYRINLATQTVEGHIEDCEEVQTLISVPQPKKHTPGPNNYCIAKIYFGEIFDDVGFFLYNTTDGGVTCFGIGVKSSFSPLGNFFQIENQTDYATSLYHFKEDVDHPEKKSFTFIYKTPPLATITFDPAERYATVSYMHDRGKRMTDLISLPQGCRIQRLAHSHDTGLKKTIFDTETNRIIFEFRKQSEIAPAAAARAVEDEYDNYEECLLPTALSMEDIFLIYALTQASEKNIEKAAPAVRAQFNALPESCIRSSKALRLIWKQWNPYRSFEDSEDESETDFSSDEESQPAAKANQDEENQEEVDSDTHQDKMRRI